MFAPFRENPQQAIETAVVAAEQKRSRGDLYGAYVAYQNIVAQRLGADYIAADLTVFQSLADLAILFGHFQAADDLLEGMTGLCQRAGNIHRADFTVLNRIHLALDRGNWQQAKDLFGLMTPRIGSIEAIDISSDGLKQWEKQCHWPNTNADDRLILFTRLYLEIGRLFNMLGRYCDALDMLSRGLTHSTPRDSQSKPVLARRLMPWFKLASARAFLEAGLLPEAEALLDSLRTFLGFRKERSLQIHWHTLAGKLALLRGTFGDALKHFETIEDLCVQLKNKRGKAIATLNLTQVLIVVNQNQLAAKLLADITPQVEELEDQNLKRRLLLIKQLAHARSQSLVAGSTFSVSDLLQVTSPSTTSQVEQQSPPSQMSNDSVNSQASNSYAVDVAQSNQLFERDQSPNYLTFFEDRVLELQWHLSQSNLNRATEMLSHIQLTFSNTDSKLIQLKIKALEGMLAYYQGLHQIHAGSTQEGQKRLTWAAVTLDALRPELLKMELTPERWQVQRIICWCLMRLDASERDQIVLTAETTRLLDHMTDQLPPEHQVLFLLNKWTADEEYIAKQIVQLRKAKRYLQSAPWYKRPSCWWRIMQQLTQLIAHIDRHKDALAKRAVQGGSLDNSVKKSPTLWARLFKHPWRRATVSFLVLPDQVFVIRNGFLWLDFSVVPVTRLELRNRVQQWYEHLKRMPLAQRGISLFPEEFRDMSLYPESSQPSSNPITISQTLAEMLQLPYLLGTLPRYIRHLTIVPDDILHLFPFAAVRHRDRYLVESYALNIAYESFSAASNHHSSSSSSRQTAPSSLLVAISKGSSTINPLPGVIPEVKKISALFKQQHLQPKVLKDEHEGEQVEKQNVLAALPSASLLHMACHGVFHPNQPEQSGLVLNPRRSPPELLSLRELSELDLSNLHHVTLSACSSADHLVLPGRWVISLPETLCRSGTQSVLGNLWEVSDQVAISFMEQFYSYLSYFPRDQALRKTQLDCLHNRLPNCEGMKVSNPYHWAGVSLYGDYQALKPLHTLNWQTLRKSLFPVD